MEPSADHYPVAVIGGGPIGLTLANLLAVQGVRCLLVERNATTVQEPRAVSIDDESLRTMQAIGLADTVLDHVVPGYGSHYYAPNGVCFARVEPTGRPYGYPRRNAFRQPILEAQLKEALARFDHVETGYGIRLERYEADADRVTLSLAGPDGARRQVTCDHLVGCDGAASAVREQQGVQLEGTTFDERWLILDLEDNDNVVAYTQVFCDPRRPCITLPGPDRTRRYEFKLVGDETDADLLDPEMVARLLRTHGADPDATAPAQGRLPLPRPRRAALVVRPGPPRGRRRAPHAALRRAGHEQRHPRRAEPRLEDQCDPRRPRGAAPPRHL